MSGIKNLTIGHVSVDTARSSMPAPIRGRSPRPRRGAGGACRA
uniref:Uncharacterized protein n=1 Tax=Arundo donax TaxID=35708 RepID=A0A0A9G9U7_ARUDO